MLPDSTNVQATHSGLLPLYHSLSKTAKTAHVLDGMTNSLLISIGQLCDDDCVAILWTNGDSKSSKTANVSSWDQETKLTVYGTFFSLCRLHQRLRSKCEPTNRSMLSSTRILPKRNSLHISMDVAVVLRLLHGKRQSKLET
jgi:hypothetical protein